ncbi:MAG: NifB/NifX family molybdenum-iron cluster-binding protein [Candidatus Latescibacterota bacterium]
MKVAIPVAEYRGLESPVHGHFGSAACFVVVNTEALACERVANGDTAHVHGACSPVRALGGARPDAVLVGGIGRGALLGLRHAGIAVWRAPAGTVADAVRLFIAGQLEELVDQATCAGHGESAACHHARGT